MDDHANGYRAHDQDATMAAISGHFTSQVLRTLAELRIPDLLHEGPRSAERIAEFAGTDPSATFRVLRGAVLAGFAGYGETDGAFTATPALDRLRTDAPDSLRNLAVVWGSPGHWQQWGRFSDVVRTGREQSVAAHGRPIWEYFAEHPEEADLFARASAELSVPIIREAVTVIPAEPGQTVVDVGGSTGAFVLSMLAQHPGTKGVVNDLPHVEDAARREIEARDLADRCSFEASDFFDVVPPGDVHLLKFILHDWDDDACVAVLRRVREAMNPGGRVVVVDMVIGSAAAPGPATVMDLNMLAMAPGREHDHADLDRFFAAAGLRRTSTTDLTAPYCAIEAVAV